MAYNQIFWLYGNLSKIHSRVEDDTPGGGGGYMGPGGGGAPPNIGGGNPPVGVMGGSGRTFLESGRE